MAIAAPPSTNGQVVPDPIPFDRFETHEFPAGDRRVLNLKHLAPAVQNAREPVLLIAGTGTRANIFNPPTENLLKVLSSKGFDPWVLNWRSSIDLPAVKYTLDDAAVLDMPAAVQAVKDHTGADTIKAIIHCQGSCAFMMAITVGLIKDVSLVISNSSALHPVMPWQARFKLPIAVAFLNRTKVPGINPQWGLHAPDYCPRSSTGMSRPRTTNATTLCATTPASCTGTDTPAASPSAGPCPPRGRRRRHRPCSPPHRRCRAAATRRVGRGRRTLRVGRCTTAGCPAAQLWCLPGC